MEEISMAGKLIILEKNKVIFLENASSYANIVNM
jgi:hypothetical protein